MRGIYAYITHTKQKAKVTNNNNNDNNFVTAAEIQHGHLDQQYAHNAYITHTKSNNKQSSEIERSPLSSHGHQPNNQPTTSQPRNQ